MKFTTIVIFLIIAPLFCYSQQKEGNKFEIDLYTSDDAYTHFQCFAQGNYYVSPKFSTGIYIGYDFDNDIGFNRKSKKYHLGLSNRFYLLKPNVKIKPYASAIVGMNTYKITHTQHSDTHDSSWEYGLYGGVRTNISNSFSVFAEAGYGKLGIVHLGISYYL